MSNGQKITASRGDSITSLSEQHGFFWETVWNHSENSQLKNHRKDPNIIYTGDEVFIPEKTEKEESRATGSRHNFKRKGVPAKIKLRLTRLGEPRANEPYTLVLDGKLFTGSTDGDGILEQEIPPDCAGGELRLKDGKEVYPVTVGGLDPWDTPSGVQQRLNNMGYACGASGDLKDRRTAAAIKAFQAKWGLEETGEADENTMKTIDEKHV
jgi:N-acetylmuramoyl-L-alanine amidase